MKNEILELLLSNKTKYLNKVESGDIIMVNEKKEDNENLEQIFRPSFSIGEV